MIRILALSGSSRRGSLNQKILDQAAYGARAAGAEVTSIRLSDFELPIYDADWEAEYGLPKGAQALKALLADDQGLLIATPEHNGGYTALLKNALDWIVRSGELYEKPVALFNSSPRASHAQASLIETLTVMMARVISEAGVSVPLIGKDFDVEWIVSEAELSSALRSAVEAFARSIRRL